MEIILGEPLGSAGCHPLAQINTLLEAAHRTDHPVARLVELTILAPGIATAIPSIDVTNVDLNTGIVSVPDSNALHEVALGHMAQDVVADLVAGRIYGPLIPDDYGKPLLLDADTSDFAVELFDQLWSETSQFAWSLRTLPHVAFNQLIENGVPIEAIVRMCGADPLPTDPTPRRRVIHEQMMVANYWTDLLNITFATAESLSPWQLGKYSSYSRQANGGAA